jgi:hypothetical protein
MRAHLPTDWVLSDSKTIPYRLGAAGSDGLAAARVAQEQAAATAAQGPAPAASAAACKRVGDAAKVRRQERAAATARQEEKERADERPRRGRLSLATCSRANRSGAKLNTTAHVAQRESQLWRQGVQRQQRVRRRSAQPRQ